jgi:MFS family permease
VRRRLAARTYYGWIVAGCCFVAAGVMFGMTYSFSVFFAPLRSSFAVSPARVSLVFGVQTFVIFGGATVLGSALDRLGPRRLLGVGAVLLAAGQTGASYSGDYPALLASYGVVTGLGMSSLYVVAYATVPLWFDRRRGAATGLASAGLGAGLLVVAPTASWLVARSGWRPALRALSVGFLLVLAVATYLMADRHADVGSDPAVEFAGGPPSGDGGDWRARLRAVRGRVLSLPFGLVVLGWMLVYATLYVLVNHVVPFADGAGMRWAGVATLTVVGVATSAARLTVGPASDRLGRVRIFVACSAVMGAGLLALPFARGPLALFAVAVGFGVGYGGNGALLSPLVADLFGTDRLGTLYGLASIAFAVAGLLAPPLATVAYGALGSYRPVFLATGALGLLGAVCIGAAGSLLGRL